MHLAQHQIQFINITIFKSLTLNALISCHLFSLILGVVCSTGDNIFELLSVGHVIPPNQFVTSLPISVWGVISCLHLSSRGKIKRKEKKDVCCPIFSQAPCLIPAMPVENFTEHGFCNAAFLSNNVDRGKLHRSSRIIQALEN